jgi:hypothetical protein
MQRHIPVVMQSLSTLTLTMPILMIGLAFTHAKSLNFVIPKSGNGPAANIQMFALKL